MIDYWSYYREFFKTLWYIFPGPNHWTPGKAAATSLYFLFLLVTWTSWRLGSSMRIFDIEPFFCSAKKWLICMIFKLPSGGVLSHLLDTYYFRHWRTRLVRNDLACLNSILRKSLRNATVFPHDTWPMIHAFKQKELCYSNVNFDTSWWGYALRRTHNTSWWPCCIAIAWFIQQSWILAHEAPKLPSYRNKSDGLHWLVSISYQLLRFMS